MKIIHSSGEAYDLPRDAVLEMERPNPFFNAYGERSLPITLPASARNRRLAEYADDMTGERKPSQRIDAAIQAGVFFYRCKQAILSGNRKKGIETSFYLNLGSFYEKIRDVKLSTIFAGKVLSFGSVTAAIAFVRSLYVTYDSRFACFPSVIDSNISINRLGTNAADGYPRLYNDVAQTLTTDGKTIALDPGYYITPFIRANHLLSEVFGWFGYTPAENFFTRTAPFDKMVFVNSNIDTIVKGEIRYAHIVPDCTVSTLLDAFRYLFNCEFIPDEPNRIIHIELFDDVLSESSATDLTDCVVGDYTVKQPETYKQIRLTAKYVTWTSAPSSSGRPVPTLGIPTDTDEKFNSLSDLLNKYPKAEYNPVSGEFTRRGFKGTDLLVQRLGYITCDYEAEEKYETQQKDAPVVLPLVRLVTPLGGRDPTPPYIVVLLGKGRELNSKLVMDGAVEEDPETEDSGVEDNENAALDIMPCFVARREDNKADYGTTLNYAPGGIRLWNHTLSFNGPDGLFERFWRKYDNMLRNSKWEIEAELLLSESQKATLAAHKKVIISGQELLPDVIRYIPGIRRPLEGRFFTTKLYEPVDEALTESARLEGNITLYKWVLAYSQSVPGYGRYAFVDDPVTIFYDPPTAAQYAAGGKYHIRSYAVQFYNTSSVDGPVNPVAGTLTVWLEPSLK
jgi:hypothetical protein